MTELEDLVRSTLADRVATDVTRAPTYTVTEPGGVRWRRSLPWLTGAAGAGVVMAVVLTSGGPAPSGPPEASPQPTPTEASSSPPGLVGAPVAAPTGLQAVSSRRIELLVPGTWVFNDTSCGQSAADSVVRGPGVFLGDCHTPEPATKSVVLIGDADRDWRQFDITEYMADLGGPVVPITAMPFQPTQVDGRDAVRGTTELPDGRIAGLLRIDSLDVSVVVRAVDEAVVQEVLDSVRVVDSTDSAGCPVVLPAALVAAATLPAWTPPASDVENVTLCAYVGEQRALLGSSVLVDDAADVRDVVDAMAAATSIAAPPTTCSDLGGGNRAVVAMRGPDGETWAAVIDELGCGVATPWRVALADGSFVRMDSAFALALKTLLWGGVPDGLANLPTG